MRESFYGAQENVIMGSIEVINAGETTRLYLYTFRVTVVPYWTKSFFLSWKSEK